jgi:hypothetical protein
MGEEKSGDLKKLEHLLVHWIEHNEAHEEGYLKWIQRVDDAGREDVAGEIRKSLGLSREMSRCFERAIELMKGE